MGVTKEEMARVLKEARKTADTRNAAKFVAKEAGKSLLADTEATRLAGMESGAQVNVIESISIDGTAQTITEKGVALNLSAYAKKTDVASALHYKGTVASFSALPSDDNEVGDVYNITAAGGTDENGTEVKAGDNVAYTGTGWDVLAGAVDLSGYVEKETGKGLSTNDFTTAEKNQLAALEASKNETFTAEEIAAIFADE